MATVTGAAGAAGPNGASRTLRPFAAWRAASLRTRLVAAVAAAVLASVAVTLVVATILVRESVRAGAIRSLGRQADLLAAQRSHGLSSPPITAAGAFLTRPSESVAFLQRAQAAFLLPPADAAAVTAGRPVQGTITIRGQQRWFAARASGRETVVLTRPASIDIPLLPIVLLAGGVGALLAVLVAWPVARAVARPVRRVADASMELASGRSPAPLPEAGPAEVRALAGAFNHMSRELERVREAERAFLLSVSHELKTPLTAIRGNAEALSDGVVPPERGADVIGREARRLQRLVQDLLDLARLRVSAFAVHREPVELDVLVAEVVERHAAQAEGYGLRIVASAAEGAAALADHDRLLQVVSNLVENALRCTPAGGVVSVAAAGCALTVDDTGPGIDAEDLPHVFDRFHLYERHGGDRPVGTGLGLAVVRELVAAQDGRIEVRSELGRGTTFTISLPPAPVSVTEPVADDAARPGISPAGH